MWNRDKEKEEEDTTMEKSDAGTRGSGQSGRSRERSSGRQAIIGESITIEGELTGDEDLTIQGHVDGSVNLDDHAITVGPDGRVEADIVARVITVEGHVTGDLNADEQIVLRGSAEVEGDLSAPRVNLEDGSYFRGSVDMGSQSQGGGSSSSSSSGTKKTSSLSSTSSSKKGKKGSKKDDSSSGKGKDGDDAEADDAA